jgi:hypothetical protein
VAQAVQGEAALAYERVRADVLGGRARPDALGAFAFHGMWHGLRVLSSAVDCSSRSPITPPATPAAPTGTLDRHACQALSA